MSNQDWSITLTPHRALSRNGYLLIMAIVVAINLAGGIAFWRMGAWPVAGFLGLDVLAIWWAFKLNFASQNAAERIVTAGDEVKLLRYFPDGTQREAKFNRRWLRIELEYDEPRELVGRLLLCSKGERHEIASFLGADERQSLAKALRARL
jgi:uncharacterized membrane protein